VCGCARPPAVCSNQVLEPAEAGSWRTLTAGEQRQNLAAMRETVEGLPPGARPAPAPQKVRWSDVEGAATAALDDVEAASVCTERSPDGRTIRFLLRTVEDWPGELVVTRVDDGRVYEARAWIGLFPAMPQRLDRRDALLEAFARRMEELGRLPWFNDPR
jgi:hypothetical protein